MSKDLKTPMDPLDEARQLIANDDRADFDFAGRGFIATRQDPLIKRHDGRVAFDLSWYDFLDAEPPRDRQSQPVATSRHPDQARSVQGGRPHLPGARFRRFNRLLHRRGHRLDRRRSADNDRGGTRSPRTRAGACGSQAGDRRDLLAQPCRSLWRRGWRHTSRRRRRRHREGDRTGRFPPTRGIGKHHRRAGDAPPRTVPVRPHPALLRSGRDHLRPRTSPIAWFAFTHRPNRSCDAHRARVHHRRCHAGVPTDPKHRSTGRNELLPAAIPRRIHGRERQPHHAQPAARPRRLGARRQGLGRLPDRIDPPVRAPKRHHVRRPRHPALRPAGDHPLPEQPSRRLQVPARPDRAADEHRPDRIGNRRGPAVAGRAGQAMVQPRLPTAR